MSLIKTFCVCMYAPVHLCIYFQTENNHFTFAKFMAFKLFLLPGFVGLIQEENIFGFDNNKGVTSRFYYVFSA